MLLGMVPKPLAGPSITYIRQPKTVVSTSMIEKNTKILRRELASDRVRTLASLRNCSSLSTLKIRRMRIRRMISMELAWGSSKAM